jgi:pesticin/yersiniabactin receptor
MKTKACGASLTLLGIALIPTHAVAQEADTSLAGTVLEPITVVSTKRAQDAFDVPSAISVATAEDLAQRNFQTVGDLDRVLSDVEINQRSSRVYSNVTIRGQSSVDFYNPTTQLYIDGLPQSFMTFSQVLPQNLEHVELLYGPQGTLYGRGAVGGVINIETRRPDNEVRGAATAGVSTLGQDIGGSVNAPLIGGVLYGDASFNIRKEEGEYVDLSSGDEFGDSKDISGQVRLRYAPTGGPVDVMLMAARSKLKSDEEQFVFASDIKRRLALPFASHYELDSASYGVTASYDLGTAKVTALTGYRDISLDRTIFGSFSPESEATFSQELRIASNPGQNGVFDYVFGVYYQNLDFERFVLVQNQTARQTIDSYAAFGEVTWHATDRLDITPGVRFDYEKAEADASGTINFSDSEDFSGVTSKLALGYRLTDVWRLYGLYSQGFKAGGFTRTIPVSGNTFSYDPQRTDNFEVGAKYKALDGHLEFGAAAYYNYTKDYQLFVGAQPFQFLQNVGEVESKGVQVDATLRPFGEWQIKVAAALNDTRFAEYDNPINPGVDLSGNVVPFAPKVTANLNIAYRIDAGSYGYVIPHAGVSYVGTTFFDEANEVQQDAYVLLDAGVSWKLNETVTADLYVDNITDETYAVYGFDGALIGSPDDVLQLGQGRSIGGRVSMKF